MPRSLVEVMLGNMNDLPSNGGVSETMITENTVLGKMIPD